MGCAVDNTGPGATVGSRHYGVFSFINTETDTYICDLIGSVYFQIYFVNSFQL